MRHPKWNWVKWWDKKFRAFNSNVNDNHGWTLVINACKKGPKYVVKSLLCRSFSKQTINLNSKDISGWTPFSFFKREKEIIWFLIEMIIYLESPLFFMAKMFPKWLLPYDLHRTTILWRACKKSDYRKAAEHARFNWVSFSRGCHGACSTRGTLRETFFLFLSSQLF